MGKKSFAWWKQPAVHYAVISFYVPRWGDMVYAYLDAINASCLLTVSKGAVLFFSQLEAKEWGNEAIKMLLKHNIMFFYLFSREVLTVFDDGILCLNKRLMYAPARHPVVWFLL